ncbi:hypothetical protein FQZ97_839200 [compost metagenome]
MRLHRLTPHPAAGQAVHPQAVLGEFVGEVAHRHRQGALGNRIGAAAGVGLVHAEGADHHDGAGALGLHLRQHGAGQVQRAEQVDVQRLLHQLIGAAFQRVEAAVGVGAVDQRVDPPEARHRGLGEGPAGRLVAHVGRLPEHLAVGAQGLDLLLRLAQARLTAGTDGHRAGARKGRLQGQLDAHARADAGNHHDLVFQQHVRFLLLLSIRFS